MSDPNVILAEILRLQKEQSQQIGKLAYEMGTTREIVEKIDLRQDDQDKVLIGHMKHEESVLDGIKDAQEQLRLAQERLARGFPRHPKTGERDPAYHGDWHEDDIDKALDRKDLWKKLREWAAIGLLGVICTGIGALLLSGAKVEVKRVIVEQPEAKK